MTSLANQAIIGLFVIVGSLRLPTRQCRTRCRIACRWLTRRWIANRALYYVGHVHLSFLLLSVSCARLSPSSSLTGLPVREVGVGIGAVVGVAEGGLVGRGVGFGVGFNVGFEVGFDVGLGVCERRRGKNGLVRGWARSSMRAERIKLGDILTAMECGSVHVPADETWFHILTLTWRGSLDTVPARGEFV